jgi:hypothetical protein
MHSYRIYVHSQCHAVGMVQTMCNSDLATLVVGESRRTYCTCPEMCRVCVLQTLGATCIQHDSPGKFFRVIGVVGVALAGLQEHAPVGLEEGVAMDCSDPHSIEERQQMACWLNQLPLQLVVAYSQFFKGFLEEKTHQMWRGRHSCAPQQLVDLLRLQSSQPLQPMQDQQLYSLQCASACCETGKRFAATTACTDTALFKVCHPAFVCIQIRWIGLDSMYALELIIRERRTTGALPVKTTRYAAMRAVCCLAVGAGTASLSIPLNSSSKKPSSTALFWPAACTAVLNADKPSRTAFRALLRSSDLQEIADLILRLLFCLHLLCVRCRLLALDFCLGQCASMLNHEDA